MRLLIHAYIAYPPHTSRMAYGTRGAGGGHTENMLDDNVLGSVDNQENLEAPGTDTQGDVDVRRRRRREVHVQQKVKYGERGYFSLERKRKMCYFYLRKSEMNALFL